MPNPMTFRRGLGLFAIVALLATGCGAKGTSEGSSVTTAPSGDPTATTVTTSDSTVPDTTTTTEPDDGMVTSEDLKAILPSASDIGPNYTEVADDGSSANDPDPIGDALTEQCPQVDELNGDDDNEGEVSVKFEDDEKRSVEIKLSPTAKERTPEELADFVAAVNDCTNVTASDDRFDYAITLAAGEEPSLGDQAVRLAVSITISGDDLPAPLALNTYGYNFRIGTVGGQVTGGDGTDGTTRIKFDSGDLDPLALDLEARVNELLGN